MQQATLNVQGMSCGHCVSAVEKAVRSLGGTAKVDLQAGKVEVEFDDGKVQLAAIKEAIEEQGYDVV